ncbi:MAG: bifunctional nuclease family protein [Chloroflexota bacterium]|nr:bifunctional nuclease family protein [Chloroflexota bacterium]
MIEVFVAGLGIAPPSSSPLLLLKERDGERVLPIGIGPVEAQAIAMPLQGIRPPRPMTHDVFSEVIADLGGHLRRVEITDLTDNTFHACLMVDQAGNEHTIDIRPSDAVALAVRTETPIYVGKAVFDQAGIVPTEITEARGEPDPSERKVEIDESKLSPFKEFIDTLEIDDLGPAAGENRD